MQGNTKDRLLSRTATWQSLSMATRKMRLKGSNLRDAVRKNNHSPIIGQNREESKMQHWIVRKIDALGRICVPMEIRKTLGIDTEERPGMHLVTDVLNHELYIYEGNSSRRLDHLGRYTIPKEVRRMNGWDEGTPLEIWLEDEEIHFRKFGCEWCVETEDLIEIHGHRICRECARKIVERYEEGML
mgnify:CR=1 FL=1